MDVFAGQTEVVTHEKTSLTFQCFCHHNEDQFKNSKFTLYYFFQTMTKQKKCQKFIFFLFRTFKRYQTSSTKTNTMMVKSMTYKKRSVLEWFSFQFNLNQIASCFNMYCIVTMFIEGHKFISFLLSSVTLFKQSLIDWLND